MALLQTLSRSVGMGLRDGGCGPVSDSKGRHFEGEIVLWAVRWHCRYGVSYRDLEQMLGARRLGQSFDDLPLGSAVCARDREAAALAVARAAFDELARR
jgi:transposase-like protein